MLLVLADDLTGAASTATLLKQAGARVHLRDFREPTALGVEPEAIVVNTQSRDLPAKAAARRIEGCLGAYAGRPAHSLMVGRRVDTRLRGPIIEELSTLTAVLQPAIGIFSPAYPEAGVTCVDGVKYNRGRATEDLRKVLEPLAHVTCVQTAPPLAAAPGTWWIPNHERPADAQAIAGVAKERENVLVVDSGPVFAALVPNRKRRVMVVQGTARPETARQLEHLRWTESEPHTTIYRAALTGTADPATGKLVLDVKQRLARGDIAGIVVGGGLTAEAVLEALDASHLEPIGSPEPLVSVTTVVGGPYHGTLFVTKGGSVGEDETLTRLVRLVRTLAEHPPH